MEVEGRGGHLKRQYKAQTVKADGEKENPRKRQKRTSTPEESDSGSESKADRDRVTDNPKRKATKKGKGDSGEGSRSSTRAKAATPGSRGKGKDKQSEKAMKTEDSEEQSGEKEDEESSSKDSEEDKGEGLESGQEGVKPTAEASNPGEPTVANDSVEKEQTKEAMSSSSPRRGGRRSARLNGATQPTRVLRPLASRVGGTTSAPGEPNEAEKAVAATVDKLGPILYIPGKELMGLHEHIGKSLVIHVLAKYLTTGNEQVVERNLWGSTFYTDDSDVVLMIAHSGHFQLKEEVPSIYGVGVTLHIVEGKPSYPASKRFSIMSRKWKDPHNASLQVEEVQIFPEKPSNWARLTSLSGRRGKRRKVVQQKQEERQEEDTQKKDMEEEEQMDTEEGTQNEEKQEENEDQIEKRETQPTQKRIVSLQELALQSIAQNSAASRSLKRKIAPSVNLTKALLTKRLRAFGEKREVDRWAPLPNSPVHFNLSNDPCYKYTLSMISDKGIEKEHWTSTRLRSHVLYLESESIRYELSCLEVDEAQTGLQLLSDTGKGKEKQTGKDVKKEKEGTQGTSGMRTVYSDRYRWSEVLCPFVLDRQEMKKLGTPLLAEKVKVLADDLLWTEIVWGEKSVTVKGISYPVRSFFWCGRKETAH